jgi:hypothetical protein
MIHDKYKIQYKIHDSVGKALGTANQDRATFNSHALSFSFQAYFKRPAASHVTNALETIDNEVFQLISYCF